MANKIYNSQSRKYSILTGNDSVGSYLLYENGIKFYSLNSALTNGLSTTAIVGSFAITSHNTGKGKLFSSNGSVWNELTGQGGSDVIHNNIDLLNALIDSGDGDRALFDDGTYKLLSSNSIGYTTSTYWNGKKWAALGTSITADNSYTTPLATLSEMTLVNLGVSGGSISTTSVYGPGQIYNAVANIPLDTDIVTIEAGINDFRGNSTLGQLGDTTTSTFYGALYAAINNIYADDINKTIILLTPYGNTDNYALGNFETANNNGVNIWEFVNAVREVGNWLGVKVIDVGGKSGIGGLTGSKFLSDGIHLNSTGGQRYAEYVWSQLHNYNIPTSYEEQATIVSNPQFSPSPGTYQSAQNVVIYTSTPGAEIRYTVNGSNPNSGSTLYSTPIEITDTTTIKAIGIKSGLTDSSIVTSVYTIDPEAPPSGGFNLSDAVLGDLSGTGLTVDNINSGVVNVTPTGGFSYSSLWLASGSNNACEFELNEAKGIWLTFGEGASGFSGTGDSSQGQLSYLGRFLISDGSVTLSGTPSPTSGVTPSPAVGQKWRMRRVSTNVVIEVHNGTIYNEILNIDLASQAGLTSSYYTNIKLGVLVNGNSYSKVQNVKVGTYS